MTKSHTITSIIAGMAMSWVATEIAVKTLDVYVQHIIVRGAERSPFDTWVIKTFANDNEKEAVARAGSIKEGSLAITEGANVKEVTNLYNSLPSESVNGSVSPINVWKVCSVDDPKICLLMPPDGSIIFLSGIREPDQKCTTSMSHGSKNMSLGETFISGDKLSVYTLRTKAGRKMANTVRYTTEFSVSYTCEFGSYGSYGFKLNKPLGGEQ